MNIQFSDPLNSGLKNLVSGFSRTLVLPLSHWVHPPTPSSEVLKKISQAANEGLGAAAAASHMAELAEGEEINWKDQIETNKRTLIHKLSMFATLLQMRDKAEISEEDNTSLMNLVKTATTGPNPPSLWSLFSTHYGNRLSFLQKFKAFWIYWFYYQTSLIHNTTNAYLSGFIKNVTQNLVQENSSTRVKFFTKLLEQTNQFLIADINATKAFALSSEDGDLEQYRNRAIEKVYGFSLSELCRTFSETQVDNSLPKVEFFKNFQSIPIAGLFFCLFEWFVNRFIIQSAMKAWILPNALQSVVTEGLKATDPNHLPFSLALTRFLNTQLVQLQQKLQTGSFSTGPMSQLPGTEQLPETVKHLMEALALEGCKTERDITAKLDELKHEKKGTIEKDVEAAIELAVNDAASLLLHFLNEKAASGELFAKLLEISFAPFSGQTLDQKMLLSEYKNELAILQNDGSLLLSKVIRDAVAEKFHSKASIDSKTQAEESFSNQKRVIKKVMATIVPLCEKMAEKIKDSKEHPSDTSTNIQIDLQSLLEVLRLFVNSKELISSTAETSSDVDLKEMWLIVTPLYEKIHSLLQRALELQKLQDQFPSHAKVSFHLIKISHILSNPLTAQRLQDLSHHADEMAHCRVKNVPLIKEIKELLEELSLRFQKISKEQAVIDAICGIYPPRHSVHDRVVPGPLDHLLNNALGVPPVGFRKTHCLQEINRFLSYLPENEKQELQQIIGDGNHILTRYNLLQKAMQRIYSSHIQTQEPDKLSLDALLKLKATWTHSLSEKYRSLKEKDHNSMEHEIEAMCNQARNLARTVEAAKLQLPDADSHWTPRTVTTAIGLTGTLTGYALSSATFFRYLAPFITSLMAGGAGFWYAYQSKNETQNRTLEALKKPTGKMQRTHFQQLAWKVAPSGLTALAVASLTPFVHPWLGAVTAAAGGFLGAYAGNKSHQEAASQAEQAAFTRTWELASSAIELLKRSRVYKAFFTRVMLAMS